MVKSSANLKNVGVVSGFIKKPNGFPAILSFVRISQNCFYIEKSHGSSLWITGSRLPLSPWWTRDHRAARPLQAREVIVIYSLKRERERGRCWGSHQWCHMEAELQRWSHKGAQQRRLIVLR
jgi:hypothetical protein